MGGDRESELAGRGEQREDKDLRSDRPRTMADDDSDDVPMSLPARQAPIFYGSLAGEVLKKDFDGKQGGEAKEEEAGGGEEKEGEGNEEEAEDMEAEEEEEEDEEAEAARRFELSENSRKAQERQEQVLAELDMKRRARALAVPTNDAEVRRRLRALGEPVTLFGEREMERRGRLRSIMARMDAQGQLDVLYAATEGTVEREAAAAPESEAPPGKAELFYTEGSEDLLQARRAIASFSLPRAYTRIQRTKRLREDPDEDEEVEAQAVLSCVTNKLTMACSEIGDERPLSGCAFSPDASFLLTSGWSGNARLWRVPGVKSFALLRGHTERVTSVAFHPLSCFPSLSPSSANLATGSADRSALLWALPVNAVVHRESSIRKGEEWMEGREGGRQGEDGGRQVPGTEGQTVCSPLRKLTGHLDRLARIAFHPSGRFLGTTSFDKTWRLWDIETGTELLLQEGHSRAVYGIGFQCDGSLVATCGLDSLCRVWDLRSGRSVMALEGHVKPLLCCEFSPKGHLLATAGEDHSCRIWDLRKRAAKKACVYTIPAHNGLISQVRWEPSSGSFLLTAAYDNSTKIWSGLDFKPVRMMAGHEGKVMGADVTSEGQYVATVSYDRTIKLWAQGGL